MLLELRFIKNELRRWLKEFDFSDPSLKLYRAELQELSICADSAARLCEIAMRRAFK